MKEITYNLPDHRVGDTIRNLDFRYQQDSEDDESFLNFTGATVKLQVREWSKTGAVSLSLDLDDGLELQASGTKIVMQTITPDLGPGTYFYDLQVTWTDGSIQTLFSGQWNHFQDVTK